MNTPRSYLLCLVLALAWPAEAGAQSCNRRCAAGTPRDARGCCVSSKVKVRKIKVRKIKVRKGKKPQKEKKQVKAGARARPLRWVRIKGGKFAMPEKGSRWLGPRREVKVRSFSLTVSEVTAAQYRRCVKKKVCPAPLSGRPRCTYGSKDGNVPINCVTYEHARAFCDHVGGRLPTEAEWEFAARGRGKLQPYPWGDEPPSCDRVAMSGGDDACANKKQKGPAPVCSHPSGNTTQGLCDMGGNVCEWVSDWYSRAYTTYTDNPLGPDTGKSKVIRGGDWRTGTHRYFASTYRRKVYPTHHWDWIGIRCAK